MSYIVVFFVFLQTLCLTSCGSGFSASDSAADYGSPDTTTATADNANTIDSPSSTPPAPAATSFLVDNFTYAYDQNNTNALGALRAGSNTMAHVSFANDGLTFCTPSSQQDTAFWFEGLDTDHSDIGFYTAIEIEVSIPVGGNLTLSLTKSAADANSTIATSSHQIPYNQVTGEKTLWRVPLSQFGAVDLSDVGGLRFDGFTADSNYVFYTISVTGLRGLVSVPAPAALTTRFELPDPNQNSPSAAWDFDNYTYVSSNALGAAGSRNDDDLAILAKSVQPANGSFSGTLGITGRPYAVSGATSRVDTGDRIKLATVQSFDGPHDYTTRIFLPLAQNSHGGEKWSIASFLNCGSCTPDVNGYKPEIDIECYYADYPAGSTTLRSMLNALPSQLVCQMHIQDGSDEGYAATPVLVEADAWHVLKFRITDPNNSGHATIAVQIDDTMVQWPGDTNDKPVDFVDTSTGAWTSKSVVYPISTAFNLTISLEHLWWSASQRSTDYQTTYIDWLTVD